MQVAIFNAFYSPKVSSLVNIIRYFTAFFTNGTSEHTECFFKSNQNIIFAYKQGRGGMYQFKVGKEYCVSVQKKGLLIQTKEERFEYLKKNYNGRVDFYTITDGNINELIKDIVELAKNNQSYGSINAYITSIDHTPLGEFLLKIFKNSAKIVCSSTTYIQLSVASQIFCVKAKLEGKTKQEIIIESKRKNPVELNQILKACNFPVEQFNYVIDETV